MSVVEITLGLLLVVVIVAAIGKWVPVPLPILHVGGGIALSFAPAFRDVSIPPEVFFLLFIPPLLFADGWVIPKRDLMRALRPVMQHAIGLVFLTVIVIGYFVHWMIPSLPLAAAFALAAVLSPTDALAVNAVTSKLPIPGRVATILDGEALINDASGLVAFKFAVAAAATGIFQPGEAALQFFLLSAGGLVVGVAIAWMVGRVRRALKRYCITDPTIQTVLSLLTPYGAYLAAEAAGVGSILAVVAAGLFAGSDDSRHLDAPTRAHSWEVWTMLLFAFNGLVFVLLGVQLHSLIGEVDRAGALSVLGYALALSAALLALRITWVFFGAYWPPLLFRRIRKREGFPRIDRLFLTAWAGIRGSVTLAAALSLPLTTASGAPFPGRELIILLAASVIVITLLVNGMTLPWLIRALGIRGDGTAAREARAARIAIAQAAIDALERGMPRLDGAHEADFAGLLLEKYRSRLHHHSANAARRSQLDAVHESQRQIGRAAIRAQRDELRQMREQDVINDEVMRELESEIDVEEAQIVGARHG